MSKPDHCRLKATLPAGTAWLGLVDDRWTALSEPDGAFIFPTQLLARRYSQYLGEEMELIWDCEPVEGLDIHTAATLGDTCRHCGCTEEFACPDRCYWHAREVCSECAA